MELRKADQRHQIALVEAERLLERGALGRIVLQQPPRRGEIDQQVGGRRIGLAGPLEMFGRRPRVARTQRAQSKPVRQRGVVRCPCPHDALW